MLRFLQFFLPKGQKTEGTSPPSSLVNNEQSTTEGLEKFSIDSRDDSATDAHTTDTDVLRPNGAPSESEQGAPQGSGSALFFDTAPFKSDSSHAPALSDNPSEAQPRAPTQSHSSPSTPIANTTPSHSTATSQPSEANAQPSTADSTTAGALPGFAEPNAGNGDNSGSSGSTSSGPKPSSAALRTVTPGPAYIETQTAEINGYDQSADRHPLDSTILAQINNSVLRQNLNNRGILHLHVIQTHLIEQIGNGYDLIVNTDTATGKTVGIILSLLDGLASRKEALLQGQTFQFNQEVRQAIRKAMHYRTPANMVMSPIVVIICSTWEHAIEIFDEIAELCHGTGVIPGVVHGSTPWFSKLQEVCISDIIVATPGRFMDYTIHGHIDMSNLKLLVLEDARALLDAPNMNNQLQQAFFPTHEGHFNLRLHGELVQRILVDAAYEFRRDPRVRQWLRHNPDQGGDPRDFKLLIQKYKLVDPRTYHFVDVDPSLELESAGSEYIKSVFEASPGKALVFVLLSEAAATRVADHLHCLLGRGVFVAASTSDNSYSQRVAIDRDLRSKDKAIVTACNLFSAGVNIPAITYVFFVGIPADIPAFHNRIGRCGRLGNEGHVHVLFSQADPEAYEKYIGAKAFVQEKEPYGFLCKTFTSSEIVDDIQKRQAAVGPRDAAMAKMEKTCRAGYAKLVVDQKSSNPEFQPHWQVPAKSASPNPK